MSALDDLNAMWSSLTRTTKGYRQMPQPLTSGTSWYTAQQLYKKLQVELSVAPPPDPTPIPIPPPTPSPTTGIYWGARADGEVYGIGDPPWDMTALDMFESHAGKKVSIYHFGQPQWWVRASFDKSAHDAICARGAIPLVSYGDAVDNLADVAAGKFDAQIAAMADAYKAWGKSCFIRLWWEMNQYTSSWFNWAVPVKFSAATYVAAWRRYVGIFRTRGATNVSFVWCPNFVRTDTTRVQLLKDCFPGPDYVDWTAFDGYNAYAPSASFDTLFKLTHDSISVLTQKPMMIAEFASRDTQVFSSGVKDQWTLDCLAAVKSYPLIKAVVWFNWNILEGGIHKDWPIESSTTAQAGFHEGISDPYFLGPFSAVPTGPVPIP